MLSEAPEAATALLDVIKKPIVAASSGEPGEITPEQLARLLSKQDALTYNRRHDDWLRIMMAAHHGTNGEGVDEFVAWSLGDPDYADHENSIRDRWNRLTIKPGGVTLGTLLKALADSGHGAFIEEVLRSPAAEDFPDDLPAEIVPPTFMEKAGRIESNYRNTQRAVEAGDLGVAYDELANRAVLRAERLPWTRDIGRELNDDLIRIVREWIMEQFGFEPKKDDVSDVLFALATKNTFNPVVEYLGRRGPPQGVRFAHGGSVSAALWQDGQDLSEALRLRRHHEQQQLPSGPHRQPALPAGADRRDRSGCAEAGP